MLVSVFLIDVGKASDDKGMLLTLCLACMELSFEHALLFESAILIREEVVEH